MDDFVCSPDEVTDLKAAYPDKLFINPGVRSPGVSKNDHATPAEAMQRGATHLVVGRQICDAPDPPAEVMRLLEEELNVV